MFWYNYINIALLLIIWIILFSNIKKYTAGRMYWLVFFAVYSLTEFVTTVLEIKGINNLWVYNISKPIQFFSLFIYFLKLLHLSKKHRYIILVSCLLVYTGCMLFVKITDYNSLLDMIFSSIILVFCVGYFYMIISNDELVFQPLAEIWFVTSLFIFFGASLCINGTLNFLLKTQSEIARKLFYLLVINSYVFYFITGYALLSINKKYLKVYNGG